MSAFLLILAPAGIATVSLVLNVYLSVRLGSMHVLNRGRAEQIRHLQRELARLRPEH